MSGTKIPIDKLPVTNVVNDEDWTVIVQGSVTKRLPAAKQNLLSTSRPLATPLTGNELTPVMQDNEGRLASSLDLARLAIAKGAGLVFPTVASAASAVAALGVALGSFCATTAFSADGDRGGATYKYVALEPAHAGKQPVPGGGWLELRAEIIRAEMFGCKGDASANDSAVLQAACDYLPDGAALELRPGAVYLTDGLLLPSRPSRGVRMYCDGVCTIRARSGGNSTYLAASPSFVNNSTFSSRRVNMSGIIFDAAGLKDYAVVLSSWVAIVDRCEFTGAKVAGTFVTETTIDGTTESPSVVDNRFIGCRWNNNEGDGFRSGQYVTDYQIIGGTSHSNGGFGFNVANSGGVQIDSTHIYGNALGAASFSLFGFGTTISNNIFHGDVYIPTLSASDPVGVFGPGNVFQDGKLSMQLGGAANPSVIQIADTQFMGTSYLESTYNAESRKIVVVGGTSERPDAFQWPGSSYLSPFFVRNHWNQAAGGFINGIIRPSTVAGGVIAPNELDLLKDLAASTTSTVVVTATLDGANYASTSLRVDLDVSSVDNGFNTMRTYQATVLASATKKASSTGTASHAAVVNEVSSPASGISAAASWSITGDASAMAAALTITITHPLPSGAAPTMLSARVRAIHQAVSALTIA